MSDQSRLFFALWPDANTRQELIQLSQSLAFNEFKWVPAYNLHVTLVFMGHIDTDATNLIKQSVENITAQPFTLTFDNLSYWSKPKILCLTCRQTSPDAIMLAATLESVVANCGLHTELRPYIPHITLARQARYLPEVTIDPLAWRAEAFCLIESCSKPDGVYYKVIQQWYFKQDNQRNLML